VTGRRNEYIAPVRAGIVCDHCGDELEATGEYTDSDVRLPWTVIPTWRHVKNRRRDCTVTRSATPRGWPGKPWFDRFEAAREAIIGGKS
jgi:hypothetical protein